MPFNSPNRDNLFALAGAYFAFFSTLGLILPYLSVWLASHGYSSEQIGETLAVFSAMRVVAPPLWARMADKSGKHIRIAQLGAVLTLLAFLTLFWVDGYPTRMFSLALFSFFWTAILPQIETMTLRSLSENAHKYTQIRLWGSVGFICISVGAGHLIDRYGNGAFLYTGTIMLFLLSLTLLPVKQIAVKAAESDSGTSTFARLNWVFVLLLTSNFFSCASHGPYYNFYVLQLSGLGYSKAFAGSMMAIGVVVELIVFMVMGRLLKRWRSTDIISVSMLLTVIRWWLIGWYADSLPLLILAQTLHAASFATVHAACINWMNENVPQQIQSTAQSLYAACGFGAGNVAGAWFAGQLWLDGDGVGQAYAAAIVMAALSWLLIVVIQVRERRSAPKN